MSSPTYTLNRQRNYPEGWTIFHGEDDLGSFTAADTDEALAKATGFTEYERGLWQLRPERTSPAYSEVWEAVT